MATVFSTGMKGPLAVQRLNELWDLLTAAGSGGTGAWGGIIGELADQADLAAALAGKVTQDELGTALAAVLANPMTAAGDLIIGGAVTGGSAAPARLGKGAAGQVLMVVAGALAWVTPPPQILPVACSDEFTLLTAGIGKVTFRAQSAMTLVGVRASLTTAATGSTFIVDINKNGTSILSTKLSIDAGEKSSFTAALAAVISDTSIADDDEMSIDIDQIGSTLAGKGLKVCLIWRPA